MIQETEFKIVVPISDCPDTDLPRVARFRNYSPNSAGSQTLSYTVDVLDKKGEVFKQGHEQFTIAYYPTPQHGPSGGHTTSAFTPAFEALRTALLPLLGNLIDEALNSPAEEETEEEPHNEEEE